MPKTVSRNMSRREFLATLGIVAAGGSLAYAGLGGLSPAPVTATAATRYANSRPNIVFIINDQERQVQHWPAGWAEENLPSHQRLAANGLTFTRAFCSTAMCSPSRSTLFTGLHPAQHGVIHTLTEGGSASPTEPTLPQNIQTMGAMLGSAGYDVVLKGKWHMSKGEDGGTAPTSDQVAEYGFNGWEPTSVANDTKVENFGGGCADWDRMITDQAVEFLSTQTVASSSEQPFMLTVGLGNPHDVLSYPTTWDEVEDDGCGNYTGFDFDQGISLPTTVLEDLDSKPTCQKQARDLMNLSLGGVIAPEKKRNYVNFYAGLIKQVDVQIGRVLDAIPEEIRDNTIVIFASDHGEMGMSHGSLRQKAFNMYEETVNVPLIVHNPVMFPTGQTTNAYAALIDIMPTLATLVQVPDPEQWTFMGTDLTPLLTDATQPVQNEILFTFDDIWAGNPDGAIVNPWTGQEVPNAPKNIRAIFTQDDDGEWKYARYFDIKGVAEEQYEMYHLRDGDGDPVDPNEADNIANPTSPKYHLPAYVAKRNQLAERLAILEEERLQPLDSSKVYMPFIQR